MYDCIVLSIFLFFILRKRGKYLVEKKNYVYNLWIKYKITLHLKINIHYLMFLKCILYYVISDEMKNQVKSSAMYTDKFDKSFTQHKRLNRTVSLTKIW